MSYLRKAGYSEHHANLLFVFLSSLRSLQNLTG